ncbi:MAG: hypothetical protein A2W22_04210 [Candidatus Levybacteria bacterium RBG_16_35_11]|nr:MAG: hypothetical protein A2W22_04210 [Candidatus Levybacteria bacterium RBG_16_35_11]
MRKVKFFLFPLFLIIFFVFCAKGIFADSNFSTDYNVTYQVLPDANTRVKINVALTNLSSKYYSPSYEIIVGFKHVNNVSASDSNGKVNVQLSTTDKGTNMSFNFNKPVTGVGNKQNFSIEFDTSEVAQSYGNVWDVNIPGISQTSDFSSFNSTVTYPTFLGKPAFIKPNIPGKILTGNQITFNKDELGKSGISLAFGESQTYELNLKYHLKNPNLFPIRTEIALPPNTNYQDILINYINPAPSNVKIDKDGNWLAQYILSPSQTLNIDVNAKAKVRLMGREENLSEKDRIEYTKSKKYWETNSFNIKEKAESLKTPLEIYQFVVGTLNYDFSRASSKKPRLGASVVLANPTSTVCLEFTDLFIALARANGIPARELDGFAFTNNSQARPLSLSDDILHAWPEYYDFEKKSWIMVDPTWGNTTGGVDYFNTFDFDHIAFSIHGIDSQYPVPAGGYKIKGSKQKDVDVFLSKNFEPTSKTKIEVNLKNPLLSFLETRGEIKIINEGNSILNENQMRIYSDELKFKKSFFTISKIPPFGFASLPIVFNNEFSLTGKEKIVKIQIGNDTFEKIVTISPTYLNVWFLGGVLLVTLIIIISVLARRSRSLSISR